jgi:hypothetical protein
MTGAHRHERPNVYVTLVGLGPRRRASRPTADLRDFARQHGVSRLQASNFAKISVPFYDFKITSR